MRLLSLPYISENRPQCLPVLRSSFSQPQQFHHSRGSRTMMRLHTTIHQYTRIYYQVSPSSADRCAIYSPRHSPCSHFYSPPLITAFITLDPRSSPRNIITYTPYDRFNHYHLHPCIEFYATNQTPQTPSGHNTHIPNLSIALLCTVPTQNNPKHPSDPL